MCELYFNCTIQELSFKDEVEIQIVKDIYEGNTTRLSTYSKGRLISIDPYPCYSLYNYCSNSVKTTKWLLEYIDYKTVKYNRYCPPPLIDCILYQNVELRELYFSLHSKIYTFDHAYYCLRFKPLLYHSLELFKLHYLVDMILDDCKYSDVCSARQLLHSIKDTGKDATILHDTSRTVPLIKEMIKQLVYYIETHQNDSLQQITDIYNLNAIDTEEFSEMMSELGYQHLFEVCISAKNIEAMKCLLQNGYSVKQIQTYRFLSEPLWDSYENGLYDMFLLLLPHSDVDRLQIQHWCDLFITEENKDNKKLISTLLKCCNPAKVDDIRIYFIDIGKISFDYSFYI